MQRLAAKALGVLYVHRLYALRATQLLPGPLNSASQFAEAFGGSAKGVDRQGVWKQAMFARQMRERGK